MSTGEWMFYGGIFGAGVTVIFTAFWNLALTIRKKRL